MFQISLPTSFPAFHFNNLVVWLDSPQGNTNVENAEGWFVRGSRRFLVIPDRENSWGDTAWLVQPDGTTLKVYLPTNDVYPVEMHGESIWKDIPNPETALTQIQISVERLQSPMN